MAKALKAAGKTVKLVVYEDEGHSFGEEKAKASFKEIEAFLAEHIGPQKPQPAG